MAIEELSAIPGLDKELDGVAQRLDGARKAAGGPGQASEIVAQFGVVGLNRIGLTLVGHGHMAAGINAGLVEREAVGVVSERVGGPRSSSCWSIASLRSQTTAQLVMQRVALWTTVMM